MTLPEAQAQALRGLGGESQSLSLTPALACVSLDASAPDALAAGFAARRRRRRTITTAEVVATPTTSITPTLTSEAVRSAWKSQATVTHDYNLKLGQLQVFPTGKTLWTVVSTA